MAELLNFLALAVVAVAALVAIWSHAFNDSLVQRVGLAVLCFGSTLRFATLLRGDDLPATRFTVSYGVALFAIGTALKLWRPPHNRRRTDK